MSLTNETNLLQPVSCVHLMFNSAHNIYLRRRAWMVIVMQMRRRSDKVARCRRRRLRLAAKLAQCRNNNNMSKTDSDNNNTMVSLSFSFPQSLSFFISAFQPHKKIPSAKKDTSLVAYIVHKDISAMFVL